MLISVESCWGGTAHGIGCANDASGAGEHLVPVGERPRARTSF
jgi:hypothetical protein